MSSITNRTVVPSSTDATISSRGEAFLVGSILFITALVYSATMRFNFVFDDEGQIVQNALIKSWHFVPQYFQGQVWQYLFPNEPANYYRPLNVLWFRVNDALFGLHPAGWHLMAILLHVLVTFFAYRVARSLTARPFVAAFAALVFGVHPMRHEVVAWVSGTTESLWAALFFAAFLAYLQSRIGHRGRWVAVSCVLYSAALLAKETSIVLPAIIFAHAYIYGPSSSPEATVLPWQRRLFKAVAVALAYVPFAIAYMVLRVSVLHGFSHPIAKISARTLAFTIPSVAYFYVRQWLLPIHMSEFYDLPLRMSFDVVHVLLPALALIMLAFAVWLVRNKLGAREVAFAATWIIVPLLPAFDLGIFPGGQLVHDRYFYLPSFGASLILALAVAKLAHGAAVFGLPQRWLVATLAVMVLLAYGTANAASYWVDDYALFVHAYELAPLNPYARNGYAVELARTGDYGQALSILKQLVVELPDSWLSNFNYGRLLYEVGLYPQAETYLRRATEIDPVMPDTYLQLGLVDLKMNRLDLAEGNLRQAVALQPISAGYRFALGVVLSLRGDCAEAQTQLAETLVLSPGFPRVQEQMSKCRQASAPTVPAGIAPATGSAATSTATGIPPATSF